MMEDLSGDRRLRYLTDMLRDLSADPDPASSVNRFSATMRELYGNIGLLSVSMRHVPPGSYRVMRLMHQQGIDRTGLTDTFFAGPDAPVCSGGIIGRMIEATGPVFFRDVEVRDDPVLGDQLRPYRHILGVPAYDNGVVQNWVMFLSQNEEDFTPESVEYRFVQVNMVGGMTNYKRIVQELRDAHSWIEREIDEIASIQRGLLPTELPPIPGVRLAASYATYDRAGGDFYDLFPLDPDRQRWALLIADATGHGPSAAVVVAILSSLLHNRPEGLDSPGAILGHLNDRLIRRPINRSFVTAYLAFLDAREGRLIHACAGHPEPLCRAGSGTIRPLTCDSSLPLGVEPGCRYGDADHRAEAGETLLLYTDGIIDARDPCGAFFGEDRLRDAFVTAPPSPPQALDHMLARLHEHQRDRRPDDDQTMLLVQFEQKGGLGR